MEWQPVISHRFKLAEGPFWDEPTQALYWVDIVGKKACRLEEGHYSEWQVTEPVSAFIPTIRGDALLTMVSGVHRLDLESPPHAPSLSLFCVPDPIEGNRANEARCDAAGNLWLGSMQNNIGEQGEDLPITRRSGGLFHIGPDAKVTRLASDIGIANTLLWSTEGDCVYTADTLESVIYRHTIGAKGLGERTVWAQAHERGHPDGSAMDSQGYVWNARWDGHCLIRFAPDGCVDTIIELPVSRPTSCVFGGHDLKTLYVTSAAGDQPLDGSVLCARVDVAGMPCHRFMG